MDDELLYGVAGRWWKRSGFRDPDVFMRAAFGAGFDLVSLYGSLPAALVSACGQVRSHEETLEHHSVLPFYRPYMSQAMFGHLSCIGIHTPTRGRLCGQATIALTQVRYCPVCAVRQLEEDGVAAWQRSHNLPYVRACWLHGCGLISVAVRYERFPRLIPREMGGVRPASADDHLFANESRRLLLDSGGFATATAIAAAWRRYLHDCFGGYAATARAFLDTFSPETLATYGMAANEVSIATRVRKLAEGKAAARSPVFALLLSRMVSADDYAYIMREGAADW
ncbi:MAG: TniQ family protein [Piscinibacter sp.]|uniref:TniQ family protein n=1 Tax=Piscinibacter sp. TaxID=1903157 RepID=UPI00338E81BE|nr:TniQ family protein [Piscinibacter sp.]